MSEIQRIVDELERDHSGEPWHGSSVMEILRGVSAPQAAARSVPHVHSVWELVLHMTAWKNEVRRRLTGAPPGPPAEGDWPEVGTPTPERWAEAVDRLTAAHDALIADVRQLPESELLGASRLPGSREDGAAPSYYVLLHGLVQHDAYHAGQLALLLKVVRTL